MGRWAQSRRSGGGGVAATRGAPTTLLHMVSVTFVGPVGTIVYSGNVTAADFLGQEDLWQLGPASGNLGNAVVQGAANSLAVHFDGAPDGGDTNVTWTGTVSGVTTPDSVTI
jgi:hypothetical protein